MNELKKSKEKIIYLKREIEEKQNNFNQSYYDINSELKINKYAVENYSKKNNKDIRFFGLFGIIILLIILLVVYFVKKLSKRRLRHSIHLSLNKEPISRSKTF